MKDNGRSGNCPFLNGSDVRCSRYFNLDRVGHVFAHCVDEYRACPTYRELVDERAERKARRRGQEAVTYGRNDGGGEADPEEGWKEERRGSIERERVVPLVQVSLPGRYRKPLPGTAGFPALPGLRTGTGG